MNRRAFLQRSARAGAVLIGSAGFLAGQTGPSGTANQAPAQPTGKEPDRGEPLDPAAVRAFVSAGHRDLPKIKELLALHPAILDATVDLGRGDWESALGAAAHTGNKEIVRFLLEAGARPDLFCAAMMGEREVVVSTIRFAPQASNARGPHGLTLLYHLGYSGDVRLAETVSPHLAERSRHCNQALRSATLLGHAAFVAWLLENGVNNPNLKAFGKTALDVAVEKGFDDIAGLLRAHGGMSGN